MILDTNALSAFAEGDEDLLVQLQAAERLYLPVIVLGEYRFGIRQSRYRRAYERWLHGALDELEVLPIMDSTSERYAAICQELRQVGRPIPTNDCWIAALCREHAMPVVSRDRHFDAVEKLTRIRW